MSVIIVSIILLGLALSGSTLAFFSRFNGLDQESYRQAQALARSCANEALLQLAQNYSYAAGHQLLTLGTERCYIESITTLNSTATQKEVEIQTSANYHSAFATLTMIAVIQDPSTGTPQQATIPVVIQAAY